MIAGTVSAGLVFGLLDYAERRGVDRSRLAHDAGLDLSTFVDPDQRAPLSTYVDLMRSAKTQTGDPALALRLGAEVAMSQVSIVGLIMEASATMFDALVQMQRYGRLAAEMELATAGPRFELASKDGGLFLVDRRGDPNATPELTEAAFARLTCGPRRFLAQPHVLGVEVTHPEPSYAAVYQEVFRCPVTFRAEWNALRLHPDIASWTVAQNPRYVFGLLRVRAEDLLKQLAAAHTVRGQLEAVLLPDLHKGEVSAEAAAARLGFSRQTLFRKLRSEGATYASVLADLRFRLAVDYLRGGRVSVNETAYLLGFSDPAAFSRAFKRWAGASPKAFLAIAPPRGEG